MYLTLSFDSFTALHRVQASLVTHWFYATWIAWCHGKDTPHQPHFQGSLPPVACAASLPLSPCARMSRRDPRTEVGTMRTKGCCIDVGIPIPKTLVIWASPVTLILTLTQIGEVIRGMPISLEFWESRYPKRGDAHITVTEGLSHFISVPCFPALSVYRFLAARSSLIAHQIVVIRQTIKSYCFMFTFTSSNRPLKVVKINDIVSSWIRFILFFSGIQSRDDNVQRFSIFSTILFFYGGTVGIHGVLYGIDKKKI